MAEITKDELASLGEAILALAKRILALAGQPVAADTRADIETEYVPDQGEWSEEMVVLLKKALAYPAAITLLDMAAEKPNQEVRFPDVAVRAKVSERQVAAELGAMSKLSRKLFDGKKIWPIRWWQDSSDNVTRYVMSERIAEWWRNA